MVLAVYEPAFAASALVYVDTLSVGDDVTTAVSGACLLARAFAPIEIGEAQLFKQIERELLEVRVRQLVERQPMLGWFHA